MRLRLGILITIRCTLENMLEVRCWNPPAAAAHDSDENFGCVQGVASLVESGESDRSLAWSPTFLIAVMRQCYDGTR